MWIYIAHCHKVSNALGMLVPAEKPSFQTVSKGLIVLLCTEVVRQGVPDHGAVQYPTPLEFVAKNVHFHRFLQPCDQTRHCFTVVVRNIENIKQYRSSSYGRPKERPGTSGRLSSTLVGCFERAMISFHSVIHTCVQCLLVTTPCCGDRKHCHYVKFYLIS